MAEALKKVFTDKNAKVRAALCSGRRPPAGRPKSGSARWFLVHTDRRPCHARFLILQGLPAFVTFLTAGYPKLGSAVPLMLALQKGGADVIELGIPFSDPMADGVAIQQSNNVRTRIIAA